MEGNRRNENLKARLKKALRQHRAAMRELEDVLDGLGTPSDSNEIRFRLGRMASDYLRLTDELIAARMLTGRELVEEPKDSGPAAVMASEDAVSGIKSRAKRPTREIVLDLLEELGVPAAPSIVARFAALSGRGKMLPKLFSSLLRDERRSFEAKPIQDSYSIRNRWIVPALEVGGFRKRPGFIASSAWEPERRLIGKNTVRVIELRTILSLNRFAESQKHLSPTNASQVINWATELSLHALNVELSTRNDATHEQMISTIRIQLDTIESADAAERRESAKRLMAKPLINQLWGTQQ